MRPKPLLLTGKPGCGKTTVVQRVCEILLQQGHRLQGFYTREVRHQGRRIGFDLVTLPAGQTAPLARVDPPAPGPRLGRYRVFVETFEGRVLPLLTRIPGDLTLLVLDEIGGMELLSRAFAHRVAELLQDPPTCILATLQERQISRFLRARGLQDRVALWTLRFGEARVMVDRVLTFLTPCWTSEERG